MLTERKGGLIKEAIYSELDYDYEVVCGGITSHDYPSKYQLPADRTGTQKDQGHIGACVAMTISSIAEAYWSGELGENSEHSEGFVYGSFRYDNSTSWGLIISVAMEKWKEIGTIPKDKFDILMEMPEMKKLVKTYPELVEIAKKYKLSSYSRLRNNSTSSRDEQVKDALLKYQYGLVGSTGQHCMQLVGWDDEKDNYIFKDSYGSDSGDNGYVRVKKNSVDQIWLPIFNPITIPFEHISPDDWYYKTIKNMYFSGLATGTSPTTFEPNKPMTRAEGFTLAERIIKENQKTQQLLNKVLQDKDNLIDNGYVVL